MSDSRVTIGEVIFTSVKPIVKMAVIALVGGIFARMGVLGPEACRANATLIMSFLLPFLIFSTVVPSFDPENMSAVLILVITAVVYMFMGLIFGFIVRWFTPIPRTWKGGIVAAGLLGNWGDLIIGYISTLAKSYPFDEEKDVSLGTAYSSIFMVVQMLVIYNLGGLQLIKGDFDRPHSDVENAHGKNSDEKNPGLLMHIRSLFSTVCAWFSSRDPAMAKTSHAESSINALPATEIEEKHKNLDISKECDIQDISVSPPSSNTSQMSVVGKKKANTDQEINLPLPRRIWLAVQPFVTPPSISLVASIVIANVPQLKALFIHTPEFSMRDAPDSRPPLDFIMEITGFAGPCVPVLGLLLLGAAFSRLSIKSLPQGFWKSVVAMACLKLVVGPIIGMVWTTQLTQHTSMINESDKMLRFVMIMASGTPSATSQIYLTTIFAPLDPKGSVEMSALSALLLAQYALMMVTLTVLVSYTLFNVI